LFVDEGNKNNTIQAQLNDILKAVTDSDKRMDKRMKKLEDAFIKIDEIKSTINLVLFSRHFVFISSKTLPSPSTLVSN
jgi:hypothetical protein